MTLTGKRMDIIKMVEDGARIGITEFAPYKAELSDGTTVSLDPSIVQELLRVQYLVVINRQAWTQQIVVGARYYKERLEHAEAELDQLRKHFR